MIGPGKIANEPTSYLSLTPRYHLSDQHLLIEACTDSGPLHVQVAIELVDAWGKGSDFFSRFCSVQSELEALARFKYINGFVSEAKVIVLDG